MTRPLRPVDSPPVGPDGEAKSNGSVQSVDRALDLLEILAGKEDELGLSELSQRTGLAVGTIHRLLRTLVDRGYVSRGANRKYGLGPAVLRFAEPAGRQLGFWARPYLSQLAEVTGESANLAVLDGDRVVYLAQAQSHHRMRMFTEVGRRASTHSTAVGKVMLADLPEEQVRQMLGRVGLPSRTPNTITELPLLMEELAIVGKQGYAVDNAEEEPGVCCVAVPVHGPKGVQAAISVSAPAGRLDEKTREGIVPEMIRVAAELGRSLSAAPA